MALEFNTLRKAAENAMYISDERLCVTADGELCAEDDVRAVRLLVGKGSAIPASEAAKYGLIVDASEAAMLAAAADEAAAEAAENASAGESTSAGEEEPTKKGKKQAE